jgi:hypothetical protein
MSGEYLLKRRSNVVPFIITNLKVNCSFGIYVLLLAYCIVFKILQSSIKTQYYYCKMLQIG